MSVRGAVWRRGFEVPHFKICPKSNLIRLFLLQNAVWSLGSPWELLGLPWERFGTALGLPWGLLGPQMGLQGSRFASPWGPLEIAWARYRSDPPRPDLIPMDFDDFYLGHKGRSIKAGNLAGISGDRAPAAAGGCQWVASFLELIFNVFV